MKIEWTEEHVVFSEIDDFMLDVLQKIPLNAAALDDKVISRIYPTLTDGVDEDADEDWREHVMPGLSELFQTHMDVVIKDLKQIEKEGDEKEGEISTLTFPASHVRSWMHTLNQARLALGALHDVTEDDIEGRKKDHAGEKSFALFQIEIYGLILSLMLQHTEL